MSEERNNSTLIRKYKNGDVGAYDELINSNLGLVKSTVRRFLNRGTEYDDLVQIGTIGLIKAAQAFNPELGFNFSTYAFSMITGELRRHFRDDGMIKVSRSIKQYCAEMLKIKEQYTIEYGKEPPISYVAEKCGLSCEEAIFYLGALTPIESLNTSDDDELSPEEKIGTDNVSEFIEKFALKQAIDKLDPDERVIIHLRYSHSFTQNEVAARLGVTQVKISRMEKKIMGKLREALLE